MMPPKFSISNILTGPVGDEFFNGFVQRSYAKGALVATGDMDENGIIVVMSGRLRMFLIGEDREISLFYLGPGDMFCMHSGCLIEAIMPSELRITDIATFDQKLRANPQIAGALISILGRALASFLRTIEDLMFHDIKQRIARFFIDQVSASGRETVEATEIEIQFTVEEIAKSVGSSRQATSTAMNSLIKEGLIARQRRGAYSISSMARLRQSC